MKIPRRGSGLCLEGWGGDPGGRVLGRQSPSITVGLAEANLSTCKTRLRIGVINDIIMKCLVRTDICSH